MMKKSFRHKINKGTLNLSYALEQIDLAHMENIPSEQRRLLSAYGTFSKTDHLLDHKTSLSKFSKKTEIKASRFMTTMV